MSLQTTLARGEEAEASRRWKEHKPQCVACSMAQRRRKPAEMCQQGGKLYAAWKTSQADLKREREDKLPSPDQDALWTEEECGGRVEKLGRRTNP